MYVSGRVRELRDQCFIALNTLTRRSYIVTAIAYEYGSISITVLKVHNMHDRNFLYKFAMYLLTIIRHQRSQIMKRVYMSVKIGLLSRF